MINHACPLRRLDPSVRSLLLVCTLIGLAVAAIAVAPRSSGAPLDGGRVARFADSTLGPVARSSVAAASPFAGTSGGVYTAADGESVRIYSAAGYTAANPDFNQQQADFLASAPHGEELSKLTVVFLPLAQVQTFCGARSLACYSPDSELIIAPGDDPSPDLPASDILLHEYGHHIAQNRDNEPWAAVDYGPKRWASDENVCRQAANGTLQPGDEGSDYRLNPGEAWAETYRVLAERSLGLPVVPWTIVSSFFFPGDAALAAASADVSDPWTQSASAVVDGTFTSAQKARRLRIVTPYDGRFSLALRNRTKSVLRLQLADTKPSGATLAKATIPAGKTKTLHASVCGERQLQLQLSRRTTGAGSYSATISKP